MGGHATRSVRARRAARTLRRKDQTRDEIVDAARDIVLRDGASGFTLAAVAAELGLTNPALYYYFSSREALIAELVIREYLACGAAVRDAVEATDSGADAVEALIRTVFDRYRRELYLFTLVHQRLGDLPNIAIDEAWLERIRPVNDMLYRGAEERLLADQRAGVFPADRDARRFAFTAHQAVIGMLTTKAMTESANDPLIHRDDDLVDDVCRTFRAAARQGVSS